MSCIVCRAAPDDRTKDLARQAIMTGIPTFLIDDDQGVPKRLKARDVAE